jgi:hypothetical protein
MTKPSRSLAVPFVAIVSLGCIYPDYVGHEWNPSRTMYCQ